MQPRRDSAFLFSLALLAACASEPRDEPDTTPRAASAPETVYEADLTGL